MNAPHFGSDNGPACPMCGCTVYGYVLIGEHTISVLCISCHAHDYLRTREQPATATECSEIHRAHASERVVPYTGDASILANCLKHALEHTPHDPHMAEERAFKVATCRYIDRTNANDVRHLADAYKLLSCDARQAS